MSGSDFCVVRVITAMSGAGCESVVSIKQKMSVPDFTFFQDLDETGVKVGKAEDVAYMACDWDREVHNADSTLARRCGVQDGGLDICHLPVVKLGIVAKGSNEGGLGTDIAEIKICQCPLVEVASVIMNS